MKAGLRISVAVLLMIVLVPDTVSGLAGSGSHYPTGSPTFEQVWGRNDLPVQQLVVPRTWTWGPKANTPLTPEPYLEAPDGVRLVQYFDKSRMEEPWLAGGDPDSPWFITQGLLAREMMTGKLQLGDDTFEQHAPSQRPAAGDPDDVHGPTYATMGALMSVESRTTGGTIIQLIDRDGNISEDPELAGYGVTDAYFVPGTGYNIASVFWEFMNSNGPISVNGQFIIGPIFESPFYAVGLPLTNAYFARVKVDGQIRLVLIQCFERRCLTYTQGNPDGWEVESGNIGGHYYHWRYAEIDRDIAGVHFIVTPEDETNTVGDTHEIAVTVFDYDGTEKDGVPVTAHITSTSGTEQAHLDVTMQGTSGEDGDGVVVLSYVGSEPGTDTIVVSVNGVLDAQPVYTTWVAAAENDPAHDWVEDPAEVPSDETTDDSEADPNDPSKNDPSDDSVNGPSDGQTDPPKNEPSDDPADGPSDDGSGPPDSADPPPSGENNDSESPSGDQPGDPFMIDLAHDGSDSSVVGETHTVVAIVEDENGNTVADGTTIQFGVDGPNADEGDTAETEDGIATFTFVGTTIGDDTITATWDSVESNPVTKTWLAGAPKDLTLAHYGIESNPPVPENVIYLEPHAVVATVIDEYGNPVPDVEIDFSISGPNDQVEGATDLPGDQLHRGETDEDGLVTFTYTGTSAGQDSIVAEVVDNGELAASVEKHWLDLRISLVQAGDGENHVGTEHTVLATVEFQERESGDWSPYTAALVQFEIDGDNGDVTGQTAPSTGNSHYGETDGSGEVEFRYVGQGAGSDSITATIMIDVGSATPLDQSVTTDWFAWSITLDHGAGQPSTNQVGTSHTVVATVEDHAGNEVDGVEVGFSITAGPHKGDFSHNGHTGDQDAGQVSFSYTGSLIGQDTITATITDARAGDQGDAAGITHTWFDSQISFNPAGDMNPYFTPSEIEEIEALVVGQLDDPTNEERDQAVAEFWQEHTGHPVPNRHTVEISVTLDGQPVEAGDVNVIVVFDEGGANEQEIVNQTLTISGGKATLSYDAYESGLDTITATFGAGSASTTATWVPLADYDYDQQATYVILSFSDDNPAVDGSVTLTANVLDQFGRPVGGVDVEFTSDKQPDPLGTVTTGSNGATVLEGHNHASIEAEEITATVSGVGSDTKTIAWGTGSAYQIVLTHTNDDDENPVGTAHSVTATVVDQQGNTVLTFEEDIDLLVGSTVVDTQSAVAGVAVLTYDGPEQPRTDMITAESGDLTSNSLTKHWIAGDPFEVVLWQDGGTGQVGTEHTVIATVVDSYGNTVSSFGGGVDLMVNGGVAGTASAQEGVATLTYDGPASPSQDTISARLTNDHDVTEQSALTMTWIAGDPQTIVLSHTGQDFDSPAELNTSAVGTQHTVYAEVRDPFGNLVADGTVITFTVSNPDDSGDIYELGTGTTSTGVASFTYDGPDVARSDSIVASWGDQPNEVTSNAVTKKWEASSTEPVYGSANAYASIVDSAASCDGTPWLNTSWAQGEPDNQWAETNLPGNGLSQCLRLSGYGFEIPDGATILGIEVTIWRRGSTNHLRDHELYLLRGGVTTDANRARIDVAWTASSQPITYGYDEDLWGVTSWSAAEVNASDFGVSFRVRNSQSNQSRDAYVDAVRITIHYSQ